MTIEDLINNLKTIPPETNLPITSILKMLESVEQQIDEPQYSTWDSEKLIDDKELSIWIKRSKQTLANWRVDGKGPKFIKTYGGIAYQVKTVRNWIKSKEVQSTTQADHLK